MISEFSSFSFTRLVHETKETCIFFIVMAYHKSIFYKNSVYRKVQAQSKLLNSLSHCQANFSESKIHLNVMYSLVITQKA